MMHDVRYRDKNSYIRTTIRASGGIYLHTPDLKEYDYYQIFDLGNFGFRLRLIKEPRGLYSLYNFKKSYRKRGIRKIAHTENGLLLKTILPDMDNPTLDYELVPLHRGRGFQDFLYWHYFKA